MQVLPLPKGKNMNTNKVKLLSIISGGEAHSSPDNCDDGSCQGVIDLGDGNLVVNGLAPTSGQLATISTARVLGINRKAGECPNVMTMALFHATAISLGYKKDVNTPTT